MSQYDLSSLYSFLLHTPENGLRKMLIDNKPFSEIHFNLMMKIVKTCDEQKFIECYEKCEFPKVKIGPAEGKIREKFWGDCTTTFTSRGLLIPAAAQKIAA